MPRPWRYCHHSVHGPLRSACAARLRGRCDLPDAVPAPVLPGHDAGPVPDHAHAARLSLFGARHHLPRLLPAEWLACRSPAAALADQLLARRHRRARLLVCECERADVCDVDGDFLRLGRDDGPDVLGVRDQAREDDRATERAGPVLRVSRRRPRVDRGAAGDRVACAVRVARRHARRVARRRVPAGGRRLFDGMHRARRAAAVRQDAGGRRRAMR